MRLPIVVSVPHGGLRVPDEVESLCLLTHAQIAADSDGGAAEIYALASEVGAFVDTDVARAIVDMNRARDDRRPDGAVKTLTCWGVPVYGEPLPAATINGLLDRYHSPYHERLSELGLSGRWPLGVDCHTMEATGPPLGPDPGKERPWVCLGNANGTCPQEWIEALRGFFAEQVDGPVKINDPFRGGHITRSHASEMPWIQLELSRAPFLPIADKRQLVREALQHWTKRARK